MHDVIKITSVKEREKHWHLARGDLNLKGKGKYRGRPHRGAHPCQKIKKYLAINHPTVLDQSA